MKTLFVVAMLLAIPTASAQPDLERTAAPAVGRLCGVLRDVIEPPLCRREPPAGAGEAPTVPDRAEADRIEPGPERLLAEARSEAGEVARDPRQAPNALARLARAVAIVAGDALDHVVAFAETLVDVPLELSREVSAEIEALGHEARKGLRAASDATVAAGDAVATATRDVVDGVASAVARLFRGPTEARAPERIGTAPPSDVVARDHVDLETVLGPVREAASGL